MFVCYSRRHISGVKIDHLWWDYLTFLAFLQLLQALHLHVMDVFNCILNCRIPDTDFIYSFSHFKAHFTCSFGFLLGATLPLRIQSTLSPNWAKVTPRACMRICLFQMNQNMFPTLSQRFDINFVWRGCYKRRFLLKMRYFRSQDWAFGVQAGLISGKLAALLNTLQWWG